MKNTSVVKTQITAMCTLLVLILIVTFLSTKSINPIKVYTSHSIVGIIFISLFAVLLSTSLVQFLLTSLYRKSIELTTHKPAEDAICFGCGNPLMQFSGSHGIPMMCPICKSWWHNGPVCYNKDMQKARIAFPTYPCPKCRSGAMHNRDLFDERSFTQVTDK